MRSLQLHQTVLWRISHKNLSNYRYYQSPSDAYTKLIESYARDRSLERGKALHAHLIINGLARLTHFASKLIALYVECGGGLSDARKLFDKIPETNIRRWIVLIGAYARHGFHLEAMGVFCEMQTQGLKPSKFVLPSVLKACGHLAYRQTGEKIHSLILKHQFESDAFVSSALIDMYSKCGQVEKARRVLDGIVEKDLVTLNAMIWGYAQHGYVNEAWSLVEKMEPMGVKPNLVTWNTLIAGYSQAGDELMVCRLFGLMRMDGVEPDVVSWTSVISGLVQNFQRDKAFDTFKHMLDLRLHPSSATISSLLPACSTLADLRPGKEIHGYAVVTGVEIDVFVRSALIDMYAKCGLIHQARTLFHKMSRRNTVTWNSMIFGYANHGYCNEAIELFNKMVEMEAEKVDHLTFTAALVACSHAGMVELGHSLFRAMQQKYGIKPRMEHHACMVDLLSRAGQLVEAYDWIKSMPIQPDLFVWGALLGACRQHGNIDLAEMAAKHLHQLEPDSAGSGLLLSNLYADAGCWRNAANVKKMVKRRKLKKIMGCSWIEAI